MGRLASLCGRFASRKALFCIFDGGSEIGEIAEAAGFLCKFFLLRRDASDLLIKPGEAIAVGAHIGFKLFAPGGHIGERGGELGELALSGGERCLGFRDTFINA
jgi:hypothetical protein